MNTIINTSPPIAVDFNPIDRPRANLALTATNHLLGAHPRPLLMIGREPVAGLPSRMALSLLDAIIPLSWERLEFATENHECGGTHGAILKTQLGEQNRSSNDRLDAAFDELTSFQWRCPATLMSANFTVNTVLTDWYKCRRKYVWRFTPDFIALCQNVQLFVKYPTYNARKLKKPITYRLHELMVVFTGRHFPYWNISANELLRVLGAEKHATAKDRFFDRTILPALAQIESVTNWKIKFERFPGPQIAPTQRVRFTIRKTGGQPPIGG